MTKTMMMRFIENKEEERLAPSVCKGGLGCWQPKDMTGATKVQPDFTLLNSLLVKSEATNTGAVDGSNESLPSVECKHTRE